MTRRGGSTQQRETDLIRFRPAYDDQLNVGSNDDPAADHTGFDHTRIDDAGTGSDNGTRLAGCHRQRCATPADAGARLPTTRRRRGLTRCPDGARGAVRQPLRAPSSNRHAVPMNWRTSIKRGNLWLP